MLNDNKGGFFTAILRKGISLFNRKKKEGITVKVNRNPKLIVMKSKVNEKKIEDLKKMNTNLEVYYVNSKEEIMNILNLYPKNEFNKVKTDANIIGINTYGDISEIKVDDICNIDRIEQIPLFERLDILNTKDKLFLMNNYDSMLLFSSNPNDKAINYSHMKFCLFRHLFRTIIHNFNLFFYVLIPQYPIKELHSNQNLNLDNKIYLVQRKNFFNKNLNNRTIITIDNEDFLFTDLTNDFTMSNYMRILISKGNFFYYINNINKKAKNIIESLNTIFPHKGYYAYISNFANTNHKKSLLSFISQYKSNLSKEDASPIIIIDNSSYKEKFPMLIQTFADKYCTINTSHIKIESPIAHYEPKVLKKKIIDVNELKWYKDITIAENDYFNLKI